MIRAELMSGEPQRMDALVDPHLGLVVLDMPGAIVTVTTLASFSALAARSDYSPRLDRCDLREDVLPEFSCETNSYSVEGCILTPNRPPPLVATYQNCMRFAPELCAPSDHRGMQRLRQVESLITATVTDTTSNTQWYFGMVQGRWRLLALDVIEPCSA